MKKKKYVEASAISVKKNPQSVFYAFGKSHHCESSIYADKLQLSSETNEKKKIQERKESRERPILRSTQRE